MVMDLCRGSLLVQPWSDRTWLDAADRRRLAGFVDLLRSYPEAFAASRPIGGDPWRDEPYGYVCSDGERAFVAFANVTWQDIDLPLDAGPAWGLPDRDTWWLRWRYPDLSGPAEGVAVRRGTLVPMRPFTFMLLEIAPGDAGAVGEERPDVVAPALRPFSEPSTTLAMTLEPAGPATTEAEAEAASPTPRRIVELRAEVPPTRSADGAVVAWVRLMRDGRPLALEDVGARFSVTGTLAESAVAAAPVVRDRTYSVPWQAWRIRPGPSDVVRPLVLRVTVALDVDVVLEPGGAFIPG